MPLEQRWARLAPEAPRELAESEPESELPLVQEDAGPEVLLLGMALEHRDELVEGAEPAQRWAKVEVVARQCRHQH